MSGRSLFLNEKAIKYNQQVYTFALAGHYRHISKVQCPDEFWLIVIATKNVVSTISIRKLFANLIGLSVHLHVLLVHMNKLQNLLLCTFLLPDAVSVHVPGNTAR